MIKIKFKKSMHTPHGQEWLDIDLNINKGELVTFFGASGAGKTTFLRVLAGLVQPQEGRIEFDGETWLDSQQGIHLSSQQRQVGFVFQDNRLFPHMTVQENLNYASTNKNDQEGIQEWIDTMGLRGLENQRPEKLSGGQKQRVALIQALIRHPKILLLDEPLNDLDASSRSELQDEIIKVHENTKITTILVSHDLSEVFKMSKKVFMLDNGRIIKSGTTQEVFVNNGLNGRISGEIVEIQKDGVLNILTISVGNNITKVTVADKEMDNLTLGAKVTLTVQNISPLIKSL